MTTIKELKDILDKAIQEGKGDYEIKIWDDFSATGHRDVDTIPVYNDKYKEMWL